MKLFFKYLLKSTQEIDVFEMHALETTQCLCLTVLQIIQLPQYSNETSKLQTNQNNRN